MHDKAVTLALPDDCNNIFIKNPSRSFLNLMGLLMKQTNKTSQDKGMTNTGDNLTGNYSTEHHDHRRVKTLRQQYSDWAVALVPDKAKQKKSKMSSGTREDPEEKHL